MKVDFSKYGTCPRCMRLYRLTKDGTIRNHMAADDYCLGSRHQPQPPPKVNP